MKKFTLKQIQQIEFEILDEFAQYCDKHQLRYYLCGGTLLGAIRHKDFIPWDDDVDVLMPRPDYTKLQKLVQQIPFKSFYRLETYQLKNTPFPFGKIVDTRTKIEAKLNNVDTRLWIDIFPMDGVPENIHESDALLNKAYQWKKWYGRATTNFGTGTTWWKALLKLPIILLARMIGPAYCAVQLNQLAQQYDFNKCKYIAGISWSCGPKERMEKIKFLPYFDVEFHGKKFHAPNCWHDYLKSMYGNYMELPSTQKRYAHIFDAYWADSSCLLEE